MDILITIFNVLITIFNDMWNTLINNPVYFAIAFLGVGGILAVIIQGIVALIGEYTAA
jgi:hypothetical protein